MGARVKQCIHCMCGLGHFQLTASAPSVPPKHGTPVSQLHQPYMLCNNSVLMSVVCARHCTHTWPQVHCLGGKSLAWLAVWWPWCGLAAYGYAQPARRLKDRLTHIVFLSIMVPILAGYVPFTGAGGAFHDALWPVLKWGGAGVLRCVRWLDASFVR